MGGENPPECPIGLLVYPLPRAFLYLDWYPFFGPEVGIWVGYLHTLGEEATSGKKGSQDTINNLPISDGRGAGCHTGSEEPTVLCDPFMSRWSLEGVMKYK